MKANLPSGKNLAELQGMSRREKDANQIFEEKITEFNESMHDLGDVQPKTFVKQNADMLKSCPLFKDGGNYSEDEVEWYRAQMSEIDQLFQTMIENRAQHISDINAQADKLKKDPTAEFNLSYNDSIKQLSAKDGLGKTFGQPRRLAQERLRSEMTKCEQAQKGVDELIDRLEQLGKEALTETKLQSKPADSISIKIRMVIVQILRCVQHYGAHM